MMRSTDRILTTHVGSLPRPGSVLDLMTGERGHELDQAVSQVVDAAVREQIAHRYFRRAMSGGSVVPLEPLVCLSPAARTSSRAPTAASRPRRPRDARR